MNPLVNSKIKTGDTHFRQINRWVDEIYRALPTCLKTFSPTELRNLLVNGTAISRYIAEQTMPPTWAKSQLRWLGADSTVAAASVVLATTVDFLFFLGAGYSALKISWSLADVAWKTTTLRRRDLTLARLASIRFHTEAEIADRHGS